MRGVKGNEVMRAIFKERSNVREVNTDKDFSGIVRNDIGADLVHSNRSNSMGGSWMSDGPI